MAEWKLIYVNGLLLFQNALLSLFQQILFRKAFVPRKILIFRTGSIGDSICSFPSLVSIRNHFNQSKLTILTNAGGNNLVSLKALFDQAYYDDIIDYSAYQSIALLKLLLKKKYDLVIELPQDQVSFFTEIRNMFFFRAAGIKSGWGWQVTTSFSFRQTQEKRTSFVSERFRLLEIVNKNGVQLAANDCYPLRVSIADKRHAQELLTIAFGDTGDLKEVIAMVPGAKRPQNRYPIQRFKELVNWLTNRGYNVIVIGGPEDRDMGSQLSNSDSVSSFCGQVTPMVSAALLMHCKICISNDTGPMHLSYAVGTPVIGLFSSRDFQQKWFPPMGHIALRNNDVHCSLCFSETCANNICMQGISIESVKESFVEMEERLV